MTAAQSKLVFLAGFVAYVVIRGVYIRRAEGTETIVRRVDTLERLAMVLVFTGNLALPIAYLTTPILSFADVDLPAPAPWFGAAVMAFALWLFWRSHADLGRGWSVTLEIKAGHCLVERGVYERVRHPMYAAIFLFGFAQGLLLQNWLAGWSALATFAFMYAVRAAREEKMMCDHFGDAYRDYMRRTGRLFPPFARRAP